MLRLHIQYIKESLKTLENTPIKKKYAYVFLLFINSPFLPLWIVCVRSTNYLGLESEVKVKVAQSCPTLCRPMDYIVHGILQVRILEWVAIPFSWGSSQPGDRTQISHSAGRFFTSWAIGKPKRLEWIVYPFSMGSSWPKIQTGVSCIAVGFLTSWATREAQSWIWKNI